MTVNLADLHDASMPELRRLGHEAGVATADTLRHGELVFAIARALGEREGVQYGGGVLEIHGEGFGFLRAIEASFLPGEADIYVSQSQIRRFRLQTGDTVIGVVRPPKEGERYTALLRVETVTGDPPGDGTPAFDRAAVLQPEERLVLGDGGGSDPLGALDVWAPLALGHRGLIVGGGRAASADLLHTIVERVTRNEDLLVTVLLVAAPPEDIAWWRANTRAEVVATPLDEPQGRHVQVVDIVVERARRMAEHGEDVVLVIESLPRVARAIASEVTASGRVVGGLDASVIQRIRRIFGASRVLAEGGSLTVLAAIPGDLTSTTDRALLDDLDDVTPWLVTLHTSGAEPGTPPIDVARSRCDHADRIGTPAERAARAAARKALTGQPDDLDRLVAAVRDARVAALDSSAPTGH
jgi:transcription termination factor Rho